MELSRHSQPAVTATAEPLIAHVYGDVPPDFAAIAACGFTVVLLDSSAPWFSDRIVAEAKAEELTVVAFRMAFRR
jgi:hypothetical protein